MNEAESLGKARQNAHPNGTPRYYSDINKEDTIGVTGELEFAKRYGLKIDRTIRPEGDGHIDFKIKVISDNKFITFDVKTATKPYNLLIKEWEIDRCADCIILANYNDGIPFFIGWESKKEMKKQPKKIFSSLGIVNYYKHASELQPMDRLDEFFIRNKDNIIQIF